MSLSPLYNWPYEDDDYNSHNEGTHMAVTERDRIMLFGSVMERNRGLVGSRFAAEVTYVKPKENFDLLPLKGVELTISGKAFWGLCTSDTLEKIGRLNCAETTILLLPVVPSALGRWVQAPPPPLMENLASRVFFFRDARAERSAYNRGASYEPSCYALYVMGTSVKNPNGAVLGWTSDGRPELRYEDQLSGELERAYYEEFTGKDYPLTVVPETGYNIFAVCLACVIDGLAGEAEKRAVLGAVHYSLRTAPPCGSAECNVGGAPMKIVYRRSHLGPAVSVETGFLPKLDLFPNVSEARWLDRKVTLPWCRFPRLALDEERSIPNTFPYSGGACAYTSLYDAWMGAWFLFGKKTGEPIVERDDEDASRQSSLLCSEAQPRDRCDRFKRKITESDEDLEDCGEFEDKTTSVSMRRYTKRPRRSLRLPVRTRARGVVYLDEDDSDF
uniref:Protein IA n=1 Tax=Oates virus TaxID=2707247 RepID=A0A6H0DK19_9VIRU|nr:MAG: protein IA [Oates virus]